MRIDLCPRENELLEALGRRFIGAELRAHLNDCAPCSELEMIAGAFLDERVQAVAAASVPESGTMWWRMQVRKRHDAEASARRSLLVGQAASLAVAIVLLFAVFGGEIAIGVTELIRSFRLSTPLLLALGTWAILAPIAGYVALAQK